MNWLLIAVICIIAWNVVRGYTRGVLRMVYSLAAWIVMLAASTMAAPYVRDQILSQTGIEPVILNGIEKQIAAQGQKATGDFDMAKDGVVSIAIDYKNELNKMIQDYESALSEMSNNDKLSKGMRAEFNKTISEIRNFKTEMDKAFQNLTIGKVDKNSFKSFKQTVNKNFEDVRKQIDRLDLAVSTINSQIKILGDGVDISNISHQFKEFQEYVQNTHNAIDSLIKDLNGKNISLLSFDTSITNDAKRQIKEINNLLKSTDDFSDAKGSKYELFNFDQAQDELNTLSLDLKNTLENLEKAKSELSKYDETSLGFERTSNQIKILELRAADLYDSIEQLQNVGEIKGFNGLEISDDASVEKYYKYLDEIPPKLENIRKEAVKVKEELSKLITEPTGKPSIKMADKLNPNSAQLVAGVTIETKSSDLFKKISPILTELQSKLNSNPIVAPIRLVVAPNSISSNKNSEVDNIPEYLSKKYKKVLANTNEDAIIDIEGVYKKTFTSIMDAGVSYAKESINKI